MIERTEYLNQMIGFRDTKLIKIVTGIRRCGKSTLFELYQEYLRKDGVDEAQIIHINFEDADSEDLTDYKVLHSHIKEHLVADRMNYIFLDEIQQVKDYQKAVDSLYIRKNCDIYITGSNAYLLSGELATLLSGRYVEIKMLPLSFKEYVSAYPGQVDLSQKYISYLTNSSFPYALELLRLKKKKEINPYLDGIYNSVILKDVVTRSKISDISMLESIIRFMFDNIGNLCSFKSISDTMTSVGRKISVHTVESYLEALCGSFILYRAGRYDVKGKQHLKTGYKYYLADIGLRYYLLGTKKTDMGHILENVIYLELLRRGYEVHIGKVGTSEVDFIAIHEGETEYYQVALSVMVDKTLEREITPLNNIKDHNSKYLLTLDYTPSTSHNGIKQINALDWLLS